MKSLDRFYEYIDEAPIDMHSVIMLHHGQVVHEAYFAPFKENDLHRMFSVTKSFVSLAAGCMAAEGKLELDRPICEYFPEYPTPYEYTKRATVRDLLMMRSPHDKTTYKADISGNWVESFFKTEPTHYPGITFAYDTSASHTAAALIEKLSGMSLLDYMRVKFLDEIGFSKEAYCITDPQGVSSGGSGMMAKPMDVARVAQLVLDGGRYNGRQLIDKEYLKTAVSCLSRTETRGSFADERQGYGMQFWRTRHDCFMMYGMAGQLALMVPDKDFVLCTTADTQECRDGIQIILDAFWRTVYRELDDDCAFERRREMKIKPLAGAARKFCGEYAFDKNALGMERMGVRTDGGGGEISYTNRDGSFVLPFKYDGFYEGIFPRYNSRCATCGAWVSDNTLAVKSRIIGELVGSVTMELCFSDNGVTYSGRKTEHETMSEFAGVISGHSV